MKKSIRFFALLIAALMTITSFAAFALAEGEETDTPSESVGEESGDTSGGEESGDNSSEDVSSGNTSSGEDTPKITADIVINGVPADAINVYFNDVAVSGNYTGAPGAVAIRVEPKDGYEITSAEYKIQI
ncbi:MAG: hypothetical protein IKT34_03935, partial [Clostridia bacterium]|nr:hypothetical protein [Clostridia bacterium]